MMLYYENDMSRKIREIGSGHNKVRRNRMLKSAMNFYFTNFWLNLVMGVLSFASTVWGILQ